jgi:hypothetical protein
MRKARRTPGLFVSERYLDTPSQGIVARAAVAHARL